MHISIVTLFPDMFAGPFDASIIGRAVKSGSVTLDIVNLRDYSTDSYKSVDDHPYGGGVGMILRVDIMDRALSDIRSRHKTGVSHTVLLEPAGAPYTQRTARRLSGLEHLILIAGHYEGIDERIRTLVDEEISIGDYVLTGGEIPAMVLVDSVVRLIPGVLAKPEATEYESFGPDGILEYPQYTRPAEYRGQSVPDILLSGNHADIRTWRTRQARKRTKTRRPDLLTEQKDSPSQDR